MLKTDISDDLCVDCGYFHPTIWIDWHTENVVERLCHNCTMARLGKEQVPSYDFGSG